jgi:CDP-diacylglycerol--glycerol-3-phosphate 3-phosphatidyltransferase
VPGELLVAFARWGPLAAVAVCSLAFAAFVVRSARRGRPRSARVEKAGGSVLLSRYAMEFGLWAFGPVIRAAIRLELHPDALSWASLLLQLAAAVLVARGAFGAGAALLGVGAACDAVDGAVARGRGMASDAGEVLDAAVDRWAEMAVFFGFAWYYRSLWPGFLLAVGACAGAVMVSYTRAKAEGYGIDASGGLMQRHERAVWLTVAAVVSSAWHAWHPDPAGGAAVHLPVLVALGVIAVLANWTGWARMQATRRELRRRERAGRELRSG